MRSIRKKRYLHESDLEKKERLSKLAEFKRLNRDNQFDNESEMEKRSRLRKLAEKKQSDREERPI